MLQEEEEEEDTGGGDHGSGPKLADSWIFSSYTPIPFVSPTNCFQIVRRRYRLRFHIFRILSLLLLKA